MDTDDVAAALRRGSCPLPAGKQRDFVRAVDLDFQGGYSQTKEAAVFLKSPASQKQEQRKSLLEQPGLQRASSAPHGHHRRRQSTIEVLTPHPEAPSNSGESDEEWDPKAALDGDDESHDGEEPQAEECGTSSTTCGEIVPVSSDSGKCALEDRRGSSRSFRRGSTETTAMHPLDDKSSRGSEDSDDSDDSDDDSDEEDSDEEDPIEWDSEASLKRGIQKRASEQTRMLQLKGLVTRQKLRYSDPGADAATRIAQRQQVGSSAAQFTEVYASTVNILETNMTLEPPARRRHSVEVSELAAYRD